MVKPYDDVSGQNKPFKMLIKVLFSIIGNVAKKQHFTKLHRFRILLLSIWS